jgi:hypothetical protein
MDTKVNITRNGCERNYRARIINKINMVVERSIEIRNVTRVAGSKQ